MKKARKKPVEIEYMTFEELVELNINEKEELQINGYPIVPVRVKSVMSNIEFDIVTLEGNMRMTPLDYLIIGVRGEIYPCKIDIFNETYDKVEEEI